MSDPAPKREAPTGLKKLLEMDVKLSKEFVEFVNKKYPIDSIRTHLKSLEVRKHDYPSYSFNNCHRSPAMESLGSCLPWLGSI